MTIGILNPNVSKALDNIDIRRVKVNNAIGTLKRKLEIHNLQNMIKV